MEVSYAIHTSEVLGSHPNARLTPFVRMLLVERILAGHRVGDLAAQLGCSRASTYKWLGRGRQPACPRAPRTPPATAPMDRPCSRWGSRYEIARTATGAVSLERERCRGEPGGDRALTNA